MGREVRVPITPAVLAWAIGESGFDANAVAKRVGIDAALVRAWLSGQVQPTLTQFRALARMLRRPTATFMLSTPPRPTRPHIDFRHPPGVAERPLLPDELLRIREVSRLQRAVAWLLGELDEPTAPLPRVLSSSNPEPAANRARELLGVSIDDQTKWGSESEAVRAWRGALESAGVLVFLLPIGEEAARGFSIWDDRAPAIIVNTHWNAAARVFTLFHELGHLLTRTNSACVEDGLASQREGSPDIERWCERFAAALLMPEAPVRSAVREIARPNHQIDLSIAKAVARKFRVSLRAATIRLITLQLAGWDLYNAIPPASDAKSGGGGGTGRSRTQKRLDEYGRRTTYTIVRAVRRDVISAADAMRYLDVTDQNLLELEQSAA